MKKRDRLEVIYDILKLIKDNHNSIRPTPLLRYSNLSSQSFAEYIRELKDKGIVKEITDRKGRRFLTLTDNGFRYLDRYRMIIGFIEDFNL
ncbi:hypothetical protein HQ545_03290 [Candidatus Woesearchaeota archaeon]|nr:hypothetical protein [Candidatus Woesearchaeota archaeon]